jgi:hypothetical protein
VRFVQMPVTFGNMFNILVYFLTGGIVTTVIVLLEQSGWRLLSALATLIPVFTLIAYLFIGNQRRHGIERARQARARRYLGSVGAVHACRHMARAALEHLRRRRCTSRRLLCHRDRISSADSALRLVPIISGVTSPRPNLESFAGRHLQFVGRLSTQLARHSHRVNITDRDRRDKHEQLDFRRDQPPPRGRSSPTRPRLLRNHDPSYLVGVTHRGSRNKHIAVGAATRRARLSQL